MINGLVRRDRNTGLTGKTHHGAIPGFELGRLAVDNVSLQRRRRVFGEAIEKRHRVGNDTCRQSHSPRFGDCVHLLHATLEQPPRLRYRADDTNWGARQRTHPAERHDEQKLVPQRLVDIGGDFDLHIGQDLSIGYLSHTEDTVRLYLQETFTFLLLTAEAAVALGPPA